MAVIILETFEPSGFLMGWGAVGEWEIGEVTEAWSLRNLHNVGTSPIYRNVENCILILCSAAGELHTNKGYTYQIRALIRHLRFLDYCEDYNEHWGLHTRQRNSWIADTTVAYSVGFCWVTVSGCTDIWLKPTL